MSHAPAPDERSALLSPKKQQSWLGLGTVQIARLVTFASSFSEGYELIVFSLILGPVQKEFGLGTTGVVMLSSVPMAAGFFGYLFMGWAMDVIGRKPTLMASYAICFVGMLFMASAQSVFIFGIGRGIVGLGVRSGVICVSVYMAELSPAGHRGSLVSIEELYINMGMLTANLVAWSLMGVNAIEWRTFVTFGAVAPAVALICVLCLQVPESPRFLQMWGKDAEAAAVLRRALDGNEDEIARTLRSWKEEEATMARMTRWEQLEQVRELPGHRGFRIATYCWICRACSGIVVIGTYFGLFMKGSGEEFTLRWFMIGQLAKVIVLFLPVLWLIDSCGRRSLFLVSAVACGLCMAAASFLQLSGFPIMVIAVCVVCYFMSFSLGYGPVVWVYCFEILPHQQRGRAATVSMLCGDLFSGVLLVSAPFLLDIHRALPYALLAVTNFAAAVFFYSACPETAGMLLEHAGRLESDARTA